MVMPPSVEAEHWGVLPVRMIHAMSCLASRHNHRQVITLLLRTEPRHFIEYRGDDLIGAQLAALLEDVDQSVLAEFLFEMVESLRDSIRVDRKEVAGQQLALPGRAVPVAEQSQHGRGGVETFYRVVRAEEQAREMSTVRVSQSTTGIVEFGVEQG